MTGRRTTHLLSPSRARNTSGAPTTIMGWACGCFTTQKTAKRANCLQAQQPKPTSPPLTLWTATWIWNDDHARVKCFLGSGWPSHITSYGWFYRKTWACHLLPSVSSLPSLSLSFLRRMPQEDQSPTCLRNNSPQEPMEQIIDQGTTLVHRRNNENDHEHPRSTKVPSTAPMNLWKTYTTDKTTPCLLHPGRQHDFNMVPQMVNSAHTRKTIRLRFPCPHARRRGISMHNQLHGRFHRVTQACRPEGKGNKGSRECHTPRHTQVAHQR